jgi:hypothetical protein
VADVSPEEVARQLESHERRTDAIHQELGARITQVARDTVPLAVYQQAQQTWSDTVKRLEREHDADVQRLERERVEDLRKLREDVIKPMQDELREVKEKPALTLGRMLAIGTAVIAFAALMVQAWGTLKGVK